VLQLHLRKKQRSISGAFSASEKARLNLAKMQAERARLERADLDVSVEVLATNLKLTIGQIWDLMALEGCISYDAPLMAAQGEEREFFALHLQDNATARSTEEMVKELIDIALTVDPELANALVCQLHGGDEMPSELAYRARELLLELNP
jgi:hypothetical protein